LFRKRGRRRKNKRARRGSGFSSLREGWDGRRTACRGVTLGHATRRRGGRRGVGRRGRGGGDGGGDRESRLLQRVQVRRRRQRAGRGGDRGGTGCEGGGLSHALGEEKGGGESGVGVGERARGAGKASERGREATGHGRPFLFLSSVLRPSCLSPSCPSQAPAGLPPPPPPGQACPRPRVDSCAPPRWTSSESRGEREERNTGARAPSPSPLPSISTLITSRLPSLPALPKKGTPPGSRCSC
jgi:hypothetical protein